MMKRRTSTEIAAAFRTRYERRVGPPPQQDGTAPADASTADQLATVAIEPALASPDQGAISPAELPPGTRRCARCHVRPAIDGRPGPARCTECTSTPPGAAAETCSRCRRSLSRTPNAHYVDGQRVCRRCDPKPERRRDRLYRDDVPRARTISGAQLRRDVLANAGAEPIDIPRPRTREECRGQQRPCPWAGCSHHLYLDINPESGAIKLNHPHLEVWELRETCSLDVAERGESTLEAVAQVLNLTRERTRQIEARGLLKLKMGSPSPDELGADLLKAARASEDAP